MIAAEVAPRVVVGIDRLPVTDGAGPVVRQAQSTAARQLLRGLLTGLAGPAVAAAEIRAEPSGRPYLHGHPELGISLSHDAGLVAAAVAVDRSVGVDVQHRITPVHPRTARRVLGADAAAVLSAPDGGGYELAAVWSVQEACVKATGAGLSGRPWDIPVPPCRRTGRWRDHRWITLRRGPAPVSVAFPDQ